VLFSLLWVKTKGDASKKSHLPKNIKTRSTHFTAIKMIFFCQSYDAEKDAISSGTGTTYENLSLCFKNSHQ